MTESVATPPPLPLKPPSFQALYTRGVAMPYTEFESRIVAVWRERENGRTGPAQLCYPFNEDLCAFKLLAAVSDGLDRSDDLLLCAALNAGMGEDERARFRVWGAGLRAAAAAIAAEVELLEGMV